MNQEEKRHLCEQIFEFSAVEPEENNLFLARDFFYDYLLHRNGDISKVNSENAQIVEGPAFYAVIRHAFPSYGPELLALLPPKPDAIPPCDICTGSGITHHGESEHICSRCSGLGWIES